MNKVKLMTLVSFFVSGAAWATTTTTTTTTSPGGAQSYNAAGTNTTVETTQSSALDTQVPATRTEAGTQSSMANIDAYDTGLKEEIVGIIPQVGVVGFVDGSGSRQSRGVAGLGLDLNISPAFGTSRDKDYFLGISTGAFYSHMGPSNASFFGDNSGSGGATSANMLLIPADLKVGYNFTPAFRTSLHGGGNVLYRSTANAANTGDAVGSDSLWRLYPNAGADFEWQVGRNVSLIARPDVTFTSGPTVLMGTLGATFIPSI